MRSKNNPTQAQAQVTAQLRKINYTKRALPNVTEFPTASTSGKDRETYYVMRVEEVTWTCTCPDFRFRRKQCKHIRRYSI